ncbi:hypothetical protein JWH16_04445 [Xanthomonas campestris pv. campestris]|uniref:hypothetical protein n=1 Tax=Xanthomonas campestris TaxID=339 RepID=UPI001E3B93A4|nr:hypothetical protein [Xanthomonas campestris]MCD0253104.1 hypothetical protein [Xanthomonas campestris pv. campestris]
MKAAALNVERPLFWLTAIGSTILLPLVAILLGAGNHSIWWIVAIMGFPLVVTWVLTALERLCSPPDGHLENSRFKHLDLLTIGVGLVALLVALFHFASSWNWKFETTSTSEGAKIGLPADIFIDHDYRTVAMSDLQFEIFMARCEELSSPVRVRRVDRISYARCGRLWPDVMTFAARSSEFQPAADAWFKRDAAAAKLKTTSGMTSPVAP